jgi:hypothetical protein
LKIFLGNFLGLGSGLGGVGGVCLFGGLLGEVGWGFGLSIRGFGRFAGSVVGIVAVGLGRGAENRFGGLGWGFGVGSAGFGG